MQLAVALPWLSAKNIDVSTSATTHIPHALLGVFLVVALFGIVGLGVGALLRNQIVAVERRGHLPARHREHLRRDPGRQVRLPRTLPGGAVAGDPHTSSTQPRRQRRALLPPDGGVVVLLLWAFVPAILGATFTLNRDIT